MDREDNGDADSSRAIISTMIVIYFSRTGKNIGKPTASDTIRDFPLSSQIESEDRWIPKIKRDADK